MESVCMYVCLFVCFSLTHENGMRASAGVHHYRYNPYMYLIYIYISNGFPTCGLLCCRFDYICRVGVARSARLVSVMVAVSTPG